MSVEWRRKGKWAAHAYVDGQGLCHRARRPVERVVVPSNAERPIGGDVCSECEDMVQKMISHPAPTEVIRKVTRGDETNPRFIEYARVHGRVPTAQLNWDADVWPGGRMAGFLVWSSARVREFLRLYPHHALDGGLSPNELSQRSYDQWLASLPVGHGIDTRSATEYARERARILTRGIR